VKPENFTERTVDVDGWQVNLTTYKLGDKWHTKADDVSPGAALARIVADTREDAEVQALARAKELLARTRRHPV
jgi:hypothetical protein